jgi:predicted DNA-binding protein (MmcQ/YjbR family)
MNVDWVRELCLSFPYATEQITWGCDLTFRVGGKIFAVTVLEHARVWLSFKCSPENFAELTERNGIIPAPYLARSLWVALETKDALPPDELAGLLRVSYDLVIAKLPKKTRDALPVAPAPKPHSGKQRPSATNPPGRKQPQRNAKKQSK